MKKSQNGLRPETRRWKAAIEGAFAFEPHHLRILEAACISWDRAIEAKEKINAEGATILDRFGCPREHPACKIESRSLMVFMKALRELGLDLERPDEYSRPPSRPGGY